MEASVTKLVDLLGDAKQYLVPLFQRPYSWERNEWQTLWNDIIELCHVQNPRPHFFGSIVVIPARSIPEGVSKYSLIDGQQRYTTISIFFCALHRLAKENNDDKLAEELYERFLINKFAEGNDYFKLLPTQSDRKTYQNLMLQQPIENDSRLSKAFRFFETQIRKGQIPLRQLKEVVEKSLSVVRVLLDEKDDPYLVFESLNAKGRSLSQADLIRNYFLMRIHTNSQDQLHSQFWRPMEESLGEKNLTEFIRHYLVMRRSDFVKASETYFTLKDYVEKENRDATVELKTLSRFSTYYAKLVEPNRETDKRITDAISRLNRLEVTTAYPFLLACYDDYENNRLSAEDFLDILQTLENFIIRRFVCGVPTNQLNKIFAPLYRQVKENKSAFTESCKEVLEKRGYPKDYDFERNLSEVKLYGKGDRRVKTKFILETIETSFKHQEQVTLENLEIEHIMPQTLTDWWKHHLGDNWEFLHESMLDTLGNLTLTGYNPTLSNSDFKTKKSIYEESHLELNRYFTEMDSWREADIQLRGKELAKKCLEIWTYFGKQNIHEQVSNESERLYTFETMHNGDFLTDDVLELFEDFQDRVMRMNEVKEEVLKQCIVYRYKEKAFVSVVPLRSGLKLYLNISFQDVHHEREFCRDVSKKGHWGTGDVEVKILNTSDISRAMPLIEKAYQKQVE